jgi:hypothetical protein
MTFSDDCLYGRSQHFTFPRPQPATHLKGLPEPEFAIGDLVAQDWEGDEDEDAPQSATDFGEVMGLCYLPESGHYYPRHTWVYYIYWTHSTCGQSSYPCFEGTPSAGNELRLVGHD